MSIASAARSTEWKTQRLSLLALQGFNIESFTIPLVVHPVPHLGQIQALSLFGDDEGAGALAEPYTKDFDMTGRPMKGWVVVRPAGYGTDEALKSWVQRGVDFALTLPAK